MNFLAHLFLSGSNDDWMVGNYLGDFLNKRQIISLQEEVRRGVELHRLIDSFTDTHPEVEKACGICRSKHRKYAPILVDIYFDYLLSKNWNRFSAVPLRTFADQAYRILLQAAPTFPKATMDQTQRMIAGDWLMSYGKYQGLEFVMNKLKNRVSKPDQLNDAVETMKEHEKKLNEYFMNFFPDLISTCTAFGACINLQNEVK